MTSTATDRTGQISSSVALKAPCACAATTNIVLQAEQTIDGVTTDASRVLLTGQTDATENGIYLSDTGDWVRDEDFDGTNDCVQGTLVSVYGGTSNSGVWKLTTADPVIDSTALAFTKLSSIFASAAMTPVVTALTLALARTALGLLSGATTAVGTIATQNATAVALTGGAIDSTTIGGSTQAAASVTQLNGAQLAGFRNAIINGGFDVWQRQTSYTLTSSAAYGSADRWAVQGPNTAGIFNQDTSITAGLGFRYNAKIGRNNGSASTSSVVLAQALITNNSIPLAGKQVTLSYYAKAGANYSGSASGLSVVLSTGTGTDQSAQNVINGSWTSQANAINTTDTLTTSWQRFSHTVTLGSSITQLAAQFSYQPSGTAGADDNFYITGVQLEPGPTATPFEHRFFEIERDLSLFYYEKSFIYTTAPAQNAGTVGAVSVFLPTGATGTFGTSIRMTPKRIAPAITTYNPSATNANWRDTTNSADRTVTVGDIGENSFVVSGASGAAGSANRLHWAASAEL